MGELYLVHHGIKGQRWGVRRYQNSDGSLTEEGQRRYGKYGSKIYSRIESERKKYGVQPGRVIRDEYQNNVKTLAKRWLINGGISIGGGIATGVLSGTGVVDPAVGRLGALAIGTIASASQIANVTSFIDRQLKLQKLSNDYDVPDVYVRTGRRG